MLFIEGQEIYLLKPFKAKAKVLLEKEEELIIKKDDKIIKLRKEDIIFAIKKGNKLFYVRGEFLGKNIKSKLRKLKKISSFKF